LPELKRWFYDENEAVLVNVCDCSGMQCYAFILITCSSKFDKSLKEQHRHLRRLIVRRRLRSASEKL
jgi:hypothetical protein